jgi:uncharacterized protein YndB with AHSA1/START domain
VNAAPTSERHAARGARVPIEASVRVAARPADVFAALTEARGLERWFCARAESDARAGGALNLEWRGPDASREPYAGVWTEFRPPFACTYRGGHAGYPNDDAGDARFTLEPVAGGTRVDVRHALPDGVAHDAFAERYAAAWPRALARLAALWSAPDEEETP